MKNINKFLILAVAFFAYSCVNDTLEESSIKLDNQIVTSLSISLEQTKTHIGEKSGETYPLYWSEGDKIAINGVASEPLTEESDGKAVAQFSLNGEVSYPYNIVYPAPAEGVVAADGLQVVTFQATQNYKAGSFAEGAAPMYAQVTSEGESIEMKHLSGVLCLVPQGDATLTSLTVESASGKLAGNFDVNCADGTLAPHDDALSIVTVSFDEGLALSAEGTPIYVAVPAGDFGEVIISLHTADATEKMVVRFDTTGEKAIKAGMVREFGAFPFTPNAATEYLITTKEDLIRFASDAPTFTEYTVAKVAGAIDMTGVEWAPIEGFNYKFDGGKDEGHYIKGLSAPLFGTTAATIQNLKLTNVAITETEQGFVGSVARVLENGSLTNCVATGTLVMNNTTYTADVITGYGNFNIGGLVGRSVGATYLDCTNQVAITITAICPAASDKAYGTTVGGITGRALTKCSLERCKNDAKLLYNGTTIPAVMYMSGLVGSSDANYDTILLKDLENTANGVIEIAEGSNALKGLNLRGCIGVIYGGQTAVENIINNADIKFLGTAGGEVNISGVGGNLGAGKHTAKNLVNNGDIYFSGTAATSTNYIAGIATKTAGNVTHKIYDCHNTGDIIIDSPNAKQNMYCGGLISSNTNGIVDLNGCTNKGNITVSGTLSAAYISGMVCHATQKVTHTNSINHGAISFSGTAGNTRLSGFMAFVEKNAIDIIWTGCENKGAISHSGTSSGITTIGGYLTQAAGGSTSTWNNCINSGAITCTGHAKSNFFVGGFFGYSSAGTTLTWNNSTNKGAVTVGGKHTNSDDKKTRVGGFVGGTYSTTNFYSCTNEGDVTINLEECSSMIDCYAAGFVGDVEKGWNIHIDKAEGSDQPCVNKGTITLTGKCGDGGYVAGIAAAPTHATTEKHIVVKNAVNEGEIKCYDLASSGLVRVGGILGNQATSASQITNATNKGNIFVSNVAVESLYVGGISGAITGGLAPNGALANVGDITVEKVTLESAGVYCVGGIVGSSVVSVDGAQCYCNLNGEGKSGVGYIFGNARSETVVATNCQIGGEIATEYDEDEDVYLTEKISSNNFHKYIYGGGTTDWTGVENYDGCSALTTKPAL